MNINVGDKVKIVCKDRTLIDKSEPDKVVIGTVKSVFNAFDKDGDNWIYEIAGVDASWFLYKPNIDGGTITVLKEAKVKVYY